MALLPTRYSLSTLCAVPTFLCSLLTIRAEDYSVPKLDYKPIDFGQPVSPTLSAHCLLHHFVRQGMTLRARQLAERLMEDGTQIRASTLHAVIQHQTKRAGDGKFLPARRPSQRDPSNIIPKQVEDQSTRLALKLLLHARQHRQRCYEHTYQFIINICLVQGEIIVASLLFVLLVKDWEMKASSHTITRNRRQCGLRLFPQLRLQNAS
ncbi:uncharacterized protein EDB91DRAFT_373804 [Suillus paluster]|uniref:uncharacterized protein n=1 Tax=Suillus paluster TaxID=48578 RepID=UPI001B87FA2B|nr:uncharacterized protein EDB91DRAFT_373804 [Suillus paluster]KAG1739920.1 hypothetical protein EDB91DRAFT_373804 [Suillus paluster]